MSSTEVVQEVAALPGDRKRFVLLRPMSNVSNALQCLIIDSIKLILSRILPYLSLVLFQYDASSLEKAMFMPGDYNYHMCLIHDHSLQPSRTLYNRLRASSLLDFMEDFNV